MLLDLNFQGTQGDWVSSSMNREAGGLSRYHIMACSELHNHQTCSHCVLLILTPSTLSVSASTVHKEFLGNVLFFLYQHARKQLSCLVAFHTRLSWPFAAVTASDLMQQILLCCS